MVSIVVPFYCTKKIYFDRCMKSLLSDRKADIEVIVIDDGSPLEYQKIIDCYTFDRRVKVFHENHCGVSKARNMGVQKANGDWLMFVDSDDYLETEYFDKLQRISANNNADFIFFNGFGDKFGKSIKNKFFLSENTDYGTSIERKCQVIGAGLSLGRTPSYCKCLYTLGSPYSKLINFEFLKSSRVRFEENVKFAEDTLFSMNLILKANHIYYADEYLYHYYINEDSVTGKYRKGLSDDMNVFFKAAWMFIRENHLEDMLREAFYIRAFLESQRCIRQEFCHKSNKESKLSNEKKARKFLSKDPYKTALRADYSYLKRFECRIAVYLLKNGRVREYMAMYSILIRLKKIKSKVIGK